MSTLPSKAHSAPPHLPYLDGLRGLAALYVVVSHVYFEIGASGDGAGLPRWLALVTHFLTFGHLAVAVFIVLSGYCLMLPIVCSNDGILRGGFKGYLFRRARRILPPYYAALGLFLALIALTPTLRTPCPAAGGCRWDVALPTFTPPVLLSHLFLVHNLSLAWIVKIDPPMWSVATEWQIYFVFPLLLLPVWRRFGVLGTVAVACLIASLPRLLLSPDQNQEWACPHYLALFAFGMAGASLNFRTSRSPAQVRRAGLVVLLLFSAMLLVILGKGTVFWLNHLVLGDYITGAATTALLLYLTASSEPQTAPPALLRLLASRFAVFLGRFSYSIYLIHFPILSLCHEVLRLFLGNTGRDLIFKFFLLLLVAMPLALLVSYGFYFLVERHFVGKTRSDPPPRSFPPSPPLHLSYLDGLRGIIAVYVVLSHVYFEISQNGDGAGLPRGLALMAHFLSFAHLRVAVFIVLSGYCLMIPVARSPDGSLRGGLLGYLARRAQRILPPYYAALLLVLLLIAAVPALRVPCNEVGGCRWDVALPSFTFPVLLSHLLMVHNLSSNWIYKINPPVWSVATEWQIYFFFPLLLLPVWRRWGAAGTVGVAFLVAQLPYVLLPNNVSVEAACPQYLTLFAFGMAGAAVGFRSLISTTQLRAVGGTALIIWGVLLLILLQRGTGFWTKYVIWGDHVAGATIASLLVYLTAACREKTRLSALLLWVLESRFAVFLGRFSYSICLIHFPVLSLCHAALRPFLRSSGSDLILKFALLFFIAAPLSLLVSYIFYYLVERHFVASTGKISTVSSEAMLSLRIGAPG